MVWEFCVEIVRTCDRSLEQIHQEIFERNNEFNKQFLYGIVTIVVIGCRIAVTPPGMAREDWKIIRALAEVRPQ